MELNVLQVLGFLLEHWMDLAALGGSLWVMFTTKNQSDANKAKQAVFEMAVTAAKLAASQTIENKDRRQWAINVVLEAMGPNVKKHVDADMVGLLVEKAYLQVIKPNL